MFTKFRTKLSVHILCAIAVGRMRYAKNPPSCIRAPQTEAPSTIGYASYGALSRPSVQIFEGCQRRQTQTPRSVMMVDCPYRQNSFCNRVPISELAPVRLLLETHASLRSIFVIFVLNPPSSSLLSPGPFSCTLDDYLCRGSMLRRWQAMRYLDRSVG